MTQERLSVRRIREVLRLKHEAGLSNRAIARACRVSNSTVREYLRRAKLVDLNWPLPEDLSEAAVFVATLPASHYTYVEIQQTQELQHWLAGHVRAFAFFGGVPKILRPDNLKPGVKKPNYYEPDLNPSYQELAEHYHVAVLPARVRNPKDKASVENGVQNVERWVLAPLRDRSFFSLGEANRAIVPLLDSLNHKEMQHLGKSRRQLFEELDQPALLPLPEHPYEFARWKNARVNIDYHVAFEGHYYSVPHTLVGQEVRLRATERMLAIFHHSQQIAIHPLSSVQGRFSTCADHMPSHHRFVLHTDSDGFLREAAKVGPHTAAYVTAVLRSRPYPQQAFRTCLGILDLARKYLPIHLELACQRLLPAHLLSYKDLKSELEHLTKDMTTQPLPAHEHVRGETYFH